MPKKTNKPVPKTSSNQNRRFTKKKTNEKASPEKIDVNSDKVDANMEVNTSKEENKALKRKRSIQPNSAPTKRQKTKDDQSDGVNIKVNNDRLNSENSQALLDTSNTLEKLLVVKAASANDESKNVAKGGHKLKDKNDDQQELTPKQQKEKLKRKGPKNPYHRIIDQLPQEIRNKIDASKENVQEICKTITLPNDYKPEHVIRWIRKVSQNELKLIHEEILKIRLNERKLKRAQRFSIESSEDKEVSFNSQRSETSSKLDSKKCSSIMSRDTPNKVINYSITLAEDNSACSKTTTNTKAGSNLVRIPLDLTKKASTGHRKGGKPKPFYMKQDATLVSVNPGKSFVVRFGGQDENE